MHVVEWKSRLESEKHMRERITRQGTCKREPELERSYLVDLASSICLSQRLSHARLSISSCTTKLRTAHLIGYSLFESDISTWITVLIVELIHAKKAARPVLIR